MEQGDQTRIRVRGVDLSVRESGEGTPFLWGHGLLASMAQEDEATPLHREEPPSGLRRVRYDARGHGRSAASPDPDDYRWPELARDLWALADALGIGRAVVGGLSMGCATALHAAVAAPERTLGLVLMAPPTAWETRPRQARVYRFGAALVERLGLRPFLAVGSLARWAVRDPALAAMQRVALRHGARAEPEAVAAALRGAAASDLPALAALRALRIPALVLAWEGDPVHPLSTAHRLAETLPDVELHVARPAAAQESWPAAIDRFLEARVRVPGPRG